MVTLIILTAYRLVLIPTQLYTTFSIMLLPDHSTSTTDNPMRTVVQGPAMVGPRVLDLGTRGMRRHGVTHMS